MGVGGAVGLAAAAVSSGKVVITPTDTVYGLSAAVFKPAEVAKLEAGERAAPWAEPVAKLYEIKGRPPQQPSLILARDWQYAAMLTLQPLERIQEFCEQLDHPLTALVRARQDWGPPTTNAKGAVAVRVPKNGLITILLRFCRFLYSASANYPAGREPHLLEQVPAPIFAKAGLAIDAGPSPLRESSYLVDFTARPPRPIRGDARLRAAIETIWS
ncbi:MAG: Sua5/YciO/YrdC/YwlC family protein [Candidatus Coatesbacteria bacterium]|nr:MAG: Sua5/YciO/YrdC/YwlC family protein [Candidatus Coatesbacteria bacterium]